MSSSSAGRTARRSSRDTDRQNCATLPESARQTLAPRCRQLFKSTCTVPSLSRTTTTGALPMFRETKSPGCRNLSLVGQEHPGAIEDPLHLEPEYLVTYEDIAAHQSALHIDPTVVLGRGVPLQPWPTSVKYHLLFKLVQSASQWQAHRRLFSFDRTSDSTCPLRFAVSNQLQFLWYFGPSA